MSVIQNDEEVFVHILSMAAREKIEAHYSIEFQALQVLFVESHLGISVSGHVLFDAYGRIDVLKDIAMDMVRQRDEYLMELGRQAARDRAAFENMPFIDLDEVEREKRRKIYA